MDKKTYIPSVNFHLTKACNMKCRYCFANFKKVDTILSLSQQKLIIRLLREKGFEKINFVGGEPFLIKSLEELIKYAKKLGFYVSVVTNGSLITDSFLNKMFKYVDMIGVSIDSLCATTNFRIGRFTRNGLVPDKQFYTHLCNMITGYGIALKINTVISKLNLYEDFNVFIDTVKPNRWKLFQVLGVEGENNIEDTKISNSEFEGFIIRHGKVKNYLISENNNIMKGSYIMIDPQGCFFDNTQSKYTVSSPIHEIGIDDALNQINYDTAKFLKRNGDYYKTNLLTS